MTYLDHAATTPMLPEVLAAMTEQLGRVGNASSLHASGRAARRVAEQSRERLAEALGARPSEVLFTSGGTESDNLAVKGLYWARRAGRPAPPPDRRQPGRAPRRPGQRRVAGQARRRRGHLAAGRAVGPDHARRRWPTRSGDGRDVAVASVMWANNEIGAVSDIAPWPRSRTPSASRCTPTPCRRSGRCRSTSARAVSTR